MNIVKVLQFLDDKGRITLNDIIRECKVTRRTAYRYIQALRDSDLAFQVSHSSNGIMLEKLNSPDLKGISTNDVVYLVTALKLLSVFTNSHYEKEIESLIDRLTRDYKYNFSEIVCVEHLQSKNELTPSDVRTVLTHTLLKVAAIYDIPVKAMSLREDRQLGEIDLGKISLGFNKEWIIYPKGRPGIPPITVSDLDFAEMVTG